MDYRSIRGKDISSLDLASTHRLPTVSAAQALEHLGTDPRRFISTSLGALDRALNDVVSRGEHALSSPGGFQKGQVVEIWGPPGSGKTTFGIQLTANALRRGDKVVWVGSCCFSCPPSSIRPRIWICSVLRVTKSLMRFTDGFHPLFPSRLREVIEAAQDSPDEIAASLSITEQTDNLLHFRTPTLAHLIGLLCKPAATTIPSGTSLVVVDTLSSLVNYAFPRNFEPRHAQKGPGPSARRLQVLQFVISTLQKLAAARDLCVVILSQCVTKMQLDHGATLTPAINAGSWDQGIATRLVLFRDWTMEGGKVHDSHFVGIQKLSGKGGISQVFAFNIQAVRQKV
ncbi:P-loop containing nucleoside triphosphate hydrolase protein [Durotheca rogersii]|uniref:P-loop containing nucleoside triphosphate hydrolase protein n=1 Tax=Durotheca rogersii TaxID=419775 RepID=UPI00221F2095|nr:P-loop containing nucleoside triphosphate hydrolase protein [Durotheca rogersii]KAI5866752.1 P-loop containing nucleoside triphosphate hydrolase protein [Durotheca rogersii]